MPESATAYSDAVAALAEDDTNDKLHQAVADSASAPPAQKKDSRKKPSDDK